MNDDTKMVKSAERRNFLKLSAAGGFTAALVAGAAGTLWSTEAAAQTANEERDREEAAEHTMTIATAYVLGASRSYPIMQLDSEREHPERNKRQSLRQARTRRSAWCRWCTCSGGSGWHDPSRAALLSNFAPFASTVDLINMPYLCGSNQRFTNLVNSDFWKGNVSQKLKRTALKHCSTSTSTRALLLFVKAAQAQFCPHPISTALSSAYQVPRCFSSTTVWLAQTRRQWLGVKHLPRSSRVWQTRSTHLLARFMCLVSRTSCPT